MRLQPQYASTTPHISHLLRASIRATFILVMIDVAEYGTERSLQKAGFIAKLYSQLDWQHIPEDQFYV